MTIPKLFGFKDNNGTTIVIDLSAIKIISVPSFLAKNANGIILFDYTLNITVTPSQANEILGKWQEYNGLVPTNAPEDQGRIIN